VVVQIFIPQRQRLHPLRYQLPNRVLDALRVPMIREASRKLHQDPRLLLDLPQQQPARVAGDRSPVKPPLYSASSQRMKLEGFLVTLCTQKAVLLLRQKSYSQKYLCQKETAFFNFSVRNPD
jgi:hypothetical protein